MRIPNRIVTCSDTGIKYEADQKHVEICLKDVGIEEVSKVGNTPVDRFANDVRNRSGIVNATLEDELLTPSGAMKSRSIVARMSHLGQDRREM